MASLLIAISVVRPLFLIHRDRVANRLDDASLSAPLTRLHIVLTGTIAAMTVGYRVLRLPK